MKGTMILVSCFLAATAFSQSVTIVSPSGGETFNAGQKVRIKWTSDAQITSVKVEYSYDNGAIWRGIAQSDYRDSGYLNWSVPHLKKKMDSVLVKITALSNDKEPAFDIENPPTDVTDGSFAILASAPDAYEPNDDFASAYRVSPGDSVVKNAKVFYNDKNFNPSGPSQIDTANSDWDYYKINLQEGSILTVSAFCDSEGQEELNPALCVFDSLHRPIASGKSMLRFNVAQSGNYYVQVFTLGYQWFTYGLSFTTDKFALLAPVGGETVVAGQEMTIRWQKCNAISNIMLEYSCDGAKTWNKIQNVTMPLDSASSASGSYTWIVPARKQSTNQAHVRTTLLYGIGNYDSIVSGEFTIQATPPDAYEPNNGFSSAYPIALGDSGVKNAWVYMNENAVMAEDTAELTPQHPVRDIGMRWNDTAHLDADVYKITLPAGKLISISMFPCFPSSRFGIIYGLCPPAIALFDDSEKEAALTYSGPESAHWGLNPEYQFETSRAGVYYIKILPEWLQTWSNYGLSIRTMTILSTQTSAIDTAAMQKTDGETYMASLSSEATNLQLNLTLDKKIPGSVTTSVLSPDEMPFAENTKMKVKAISIGAADTNFSASIKTAYISIPYSVSSLNGNPEKSLAVFWLNNATKQWTPVSSSIDTLKHQIVAHTTHFSIYGVFVNSNTAIGEPAAKLPAVAGIKAQFLPQKRSITVQFSLPRSAEARVLLYDIRGKCVGKTEVPGAGKSVSRLLWNIGGLSSGKYFLHLEAGPYHTEEAILIMN